MSKNNQNQDIDRGDLKQNLSEKFVWAIAYGSCIGWGAFILPEIGLSNLVQLCFYRYRNWCIINDTHCSKLWGLGRKISSFRWRLCI